MEDVETFMLLQGELYLKVVPLDWIIFSVILGYLTDEDDEIHMFSIPSITYSVYLSWHILINCYPTQLPLPSPCRWTPPPPSEYLIICMYEEKGVN